MGNDRVDHPFVDRIFVRAGYFRTMGMRLLAGRDFEESPREGGREAFIDEYMAKQFFPNSNPIGATVVDHDDKFTIIGVVQQARMYDLYQDGRGQICEQFHKGLSVMFERADVTRTFGMREFGF